MATPACQLSYFFKRMVLWGGEVGYSAQTNILLGQGLSVFLATAMNHFMYSLLADNQKQSLVLD
jgi:hypothetical protein